MSGICFILLIFCLFATNFAIEHKISLTGIPWQISNGKNVTVRGRIPGTVQTALLESGIIGEPYYRDNDAQLHWINHSNWTYDLSLLLGLKGMKNHKSIWLVCEGLDTISSVYLNDQLLGTTDNMFVRYVFDIKQHLQNGGNNIRIYFQSPVEYANEQAAKSSYVIGINSNVDFQHGERNRQYIRKEQASFSWDFAPSFPTVGIWKAIYIQCFSDIIIQDLCMVPIKDDGAWVVNVDVYFVINDIISGELTLELLNTNINSSEVITLTPTNTHFKVSLQIPTDADIKLWWPNGYGEQNMYGLLATFTVWQTTQSITKTAYFGFRTVELIQNQVSRDMSKGLTFFYQINGIPIFLKGSNWVPADSFKERITRSKLRHLLQSVVDANMNCLRVWGGGVYESTDFYDLADELGIMIWQDFMFSVNLYPVTEDFLNSVEKEIKYQMIRLKNHPSIIVWSGNNENEVGLSNGWYFTSRNFERYADDYGKLYLQTIKPIVKTADKSRPYLASSPSNGRLSESDKNGLAMNPDSTLYGDTHFYKYSGDLWNYKSYSIVRMCTEYGIQSYCSMESLEDVLAEEDLTFDSEMLERRQHHPSGKFEMKVLIEKYMDFPNSTHEKQRLADIIYMTQISQAMAIQAETEHYRRSQNFVGDNGEGLTMGAMYWQLNDVWPAPSWSSIDYNVKWKMLHYYMMKSFSPLLISPYIDDDGDLNVCLVIDEIPVTLWTDSYTKKMEFRPITQKVELLYTTYSNSDISYHISKTKKLISGTLVISMYSWTMFQPLKEWEVPYQMKTTSESVFKRELDQLMREADCPFVQSCFLFFYIKDRDEHMIPTAWLRMSNFNEAYGLRKASIEIARIIDEQSMKTEFKIILRTTKIAPFVWLDSHRIPGRFSENGFLMKDETKSVIFYAWEETDVNELETILTVKSLMDVYQ
ncbi:hypothetical protein SNE40_010376 [Patella caerulea]|uniref:Beta-mannosidase n=1 Tax=Patella caerulea TaxID=87958 RepID=A0AAN8JVV1_PATCE